MRRTRFQALIALSIVAALCATTSAIASVDSYWLNVDEIKPGMTGFGLSVFKGEQPEKFPVEVIDVLHQFRPNQDLILIRTPDPLLNKTRGVAGMSGSPVYIDGKLIGAYAYGWSYSIDPVVGVTPIRNMLAELKRNSPAVPAPIPLAQAPFSAPQRAALEQSSVRFAGIAPYQELDENNAQLWARLRKGAQDLASRVAPAQTPVMLAGFDPQSEAWLTSALEDIGMLGLSAGQGGGQQPSTASAFQDGGAIAVQLMRGDLSANGVGTVTHINKDGRLLAFGHPMMNAGPLGFPTATARVVHVFASQMRSFKLAEALSPKGTLVQDRQAAIVVDPKRNAPTIAVQIKFHGIDDAPKTTWNFEIARHRVISPMLLVSALASTFSSVAQDREPGWFQAKSQVTLAGHAPITVQDSGIISGSSGAVEALQQLRLFPILEASTGNPFEEADINAVSVEVDLKPRREGLMLRSATPKVNTVDAGARLPIFLQLMDLNGREISKTIQIDIPKNAAGRTLRITVQPGGAVQRYLAMPTNLDQLLRQITDTYPDTAFVASIKDTQPTLRFAGEVATQLPTSMLDTLGPSAIGKPLFSYQRTATDLGVPVAGSASLSIDVRAYAESENR